MEANKREWKTWLVTDEAIFSAAWEMVELAEEVKHGRKPTLQKTVTSLKRMPKS